MIKSHAQQLELRLPRIATVRKGAPKPEKGPGRDLAYFRLDRADPAVVEAWNATLGPEPTAISGILPYADPAENLSIWDELWQGKRLLWRGDGERLHVQLDGNSYVRYAPGEGPAQPAAAGQMVGKGKVARLSRLRLLMPQLRVAGIVEIMSSSAIDADELWANLMWIKATVPNLQGAPVTVFRAARQFNVTQADGKTMSVTKHMLHMMLDGRYLDALLPVAGALPAPAAPLAALPAPVAVVDDSGPDDGEWEDSDPGDSGAIDPLPAAILALPNSAMGFRNAAGAERFIAILTDDAPRDDNRILEAADRLINARADGVSGKEAAAAAIVWYKNTDVEVKMPKGKGKGAAPAADAQDGLFGDAEHLERVAATQAALATAQGQQG